MHGVAIIAALILSLANTSLVSTRKAKVRASRDLEKMQSEVGAPSSRTQGTSDSYP
jgi:hypothetical protein